MCVYGARREQIRCLELCIESKGQHDIVLCVWRHLLIYNESHAKRSRPKAEAAAIAAQVDEENSRLQAASLEKESCQRNPK